MFRSKFLFIIYKHFNYGTSLERRELDQAGTRLHDRPIQDPQAARRRQLWRSIPRLRYNQEQFASLCQTV